MKKIIISLLVLTIAVLTISGGYAFFIDSVKADDVSFSSGSFDLQISSSDIDDNNRGDRDPTVWSNQTTQSLPTPADWMPGDQHQMAIFLRNVGKNDIESLVWQLADKKQTGEMNLDEEIYLIDAFFDYNSNGIKDIGESVLEDLSFLYDANQNNLSLAELYQGISINPYELQPGSSLKLPGEESNPDIGGEAGMGQGLILTWILDPIVGLEFKECSLSEDFIFTASNMEI